MRSQSKLPLFIIISLGVHCLVLFTPAPQIPKISSAPRRIEVLYDINPQSTLTARTRKSSKPLAVNKFGVKIETPSLIKPQLKGLGPKSMEPIRVKLPSTSSKEIFVRKIESSEFAKAITPSYNDYYQVIRERIKRKAYKNFNLKAEGEIFVSFVIDRLGRVVKIKVNPERSWGPSSLFTAAKRSILEASPFPPFPKDLKFPYLTFSVIICFQYT